MRKNIKKIFELNDKMLKDYGNVIDLNSRILDLNDGLINDNASLRLRIQDLEDKLNNIEKEHEAFKRLVIEQINTILADQKEWRDCEEPSHYVIAKKIGEEE